MARYGKKIIWLAVMLAALISFFAVLAFAEDPVVEGMCGEALTWSLNTRTGKLTIDGTGTMWDYDLPDGGGEQAPWYPYRDTVRLVTVGDGAVAIGRAAFYGCTKLLSAQLGKGIVTVGSYAFGECTGLVQIHLPASLVRVGMGAFSGMEEPLVYIDDLAAWCGVVFADYTSNPLHCKGRLYLNGEKLTDAVIPDGVTRIGDFAFAYCDQLVSVTMPDSVIAVGEEAFANCHDLVSVRLSERLTELGTSAFLNCSRLKSVILPEGLTEIRARTFSWCTSLTSVVLPAGLREVQQYAFASCLSLASVILSEEVEYVGLKAFYDCPKLTDFFCFSEKVDFYGTEFTVASGATIHGYVGSPAEAYAARFGRRFEAVDSYIVGGFCGAKGGNVSWALYEGGHLVLSGNGDMDIYLYSSHVPWHAYRRFVTSVTVKEGVTSISPHSFEYCSKLSSVSLPEGVTKIGEYAFEYCVSLAAVSLPAEVRSVGDYAFSHCEQLERIDLPRNVSLIGKYAFANCSRLCEVTVPFATRIIGEGAFSDCPRLTDMKVEKGNITYRSGEGYVLDIRNRTLVAGFGDGAIPTDGSVTSIGDFAFSGRADLARVVIPLGVTYVGNSAFRDCGDLESVTVGNDVSYIGQFAFYGCDALSRLIVLSKTVTFFDAVHTVPQSTVIYGYAGSTAAAYAEKYGLSFVVIGTERDTADDMKATLSDLGLQDLTELGLAPVPAWGRMRVKGVFGFLWDCFWQIFQ